MELSNTIKKRFCKDFNLPIQVVHEPSFSYQIEQLDPHFDTKNKLKMLTTVVTALGGESGFFEESNKVKTSIIEDVQSLKVYKTLQNNRLEDYNVDNGVKQQDIYNMGNVNHTFISIDLKHANFNVFKMYDSDLVLGFDSYDEMIGSVTEFDYFKKSKYLRQVIFGNMLPKKQQKIQKWVMNKIINVLHKDVGIKMEDFVSASSDEVVFVVDPQNVEQFVDMVSRKLSTNSDTADVYKWCKVEAFTLRSIANKKFFVKENCLNDNVEFKSIQSYFFMQVYKKYNEQKITDMDKMFYFDGMLATFDKGIFDEDNE